MLSSSSSEEYFAFGIAQLAKGGGGDIERNVAFRAEHGCAGVDLFHINEDLRPEPDFVESAVVLSHSDLIIGTRAIVCPCRLLHDLTSDTFKVHEVVACLEGGHVLDALLPCLLIRAFFLLFLLDSLHIDRTEVLILGQVLVQCVRWVDRCIFFRGIFTGVFEYDLGASWVF